MGTNFFRFVKNHAFDRQTNRHRAAFSWLDRVACNSCRVVKITLAVHNIGSRTSICCFFAKLQCLKKRNLIQISHFLIL